jgi:PPOX class probable F420-dependent enzyme
MNSNPAVKFDDRFSAPMAEATPWADAARVLEEAELYWITTVRADGRPHVTPLIGLVHNGAMHFCTGPREQKYRNLEHSPRVALTTGNNAWASGLDVVVEGEAVRVSDDDDLQGLADRLEAKYGEVWHYDVADGMFRGGGSEDGAVVFRIEPSKVMAFAKDPHGQTAYRFS